MFRIGYGYDVHSFVTTRPLVLGGVHIPYYKGLLGHSDADVLIHAICDAILGAMGLRDIGHLFPDDGPEWEGVESTILLDKVWNMARKRGYQLENIDSTIIAENPKLKDYIPEMVGSIADVIGVEINRVNVKATTSEGMGFLGRGEGMAAHAICLISKKAT